MKNLQKSLILTVMFLFTSIMASAQMTKSDFENACAKITTKTHSHFNLVHNNNVDEFAMEDDFSLEYKESVVIIHNGLNEIHISYSAIKYVSVGKPDKAHAELKGKWFIIF